MKGPLHIAYVCADRGVPIGGSKGASLHVAELVRALGQTGAEVQVVAARVAEGCAETLCGATVIDVGGSRHVRRMRETLSKAAEPEICAAAAGEAAAVLLNQELTRALEKLHKTWRIDAVYERYSLWGFAASGFARANALPHLVEVNAPLTEEQKRYRDLENEPLASALERYLFASAHRVLVPSSALLPYAISRGAAPAAVKIIPNAADPARFRPPRRASDRNGTFTIGFVGSLKPWHGLDELTKAFRRLHRGWRGYRLLVVGDGPLREEMEERLRAWKLEEAITFTGATVHEEVPGWVARMDAALAPYPADAPTYFSPIKIFEYMAAGVPIVASRIGQVADILKHRRSALLHAPGDVTAMVACVEELRRRPGAAARMAGEARSQLVRGYTWKKNAQRVQQQIRAVQRELAAPGESAAKRR